MARQRVKTTRTKTRQRKIGTNQERCHICHGSGIVPKRKK